MTTFRGGECHRTNGLGYCEAFGNDLGGDLLCHFIPLVVLAFFYFCDVLFSGTYQLMGVDSLGVVLTGHIWWEIPPGNNYDVIYGGKSQPAQGNDVTSCHKAM